ncbi:MAG TPA: BON domain-containing protein [Chloroflexota bacterium]|nr:BON domain-containing protein [Chloroflexota bacterium]
MYQPENSDRSALTDEQRARLVDDELRNAEISLVVSVQGREVRLSGVVHSHTQRAHAVTIARRVLPGFRIVSEIAVRPPEPEPIPGDVVVRIHPDEPEVADRYVTDITQTTEQGLAFFPPTDPVVVPGERGLELRGGFSATSMDSLTENENASTPDEPGSRGDEAIADDIRRELAEDSMTAFLSIDVRVERGVATLSGTVRHLEDADAAEEVAARVPGVVDVRERLEVLGV